MKKTTLTVLTLLLSCIFVSCQDFSREQLENSPRHHEWVEINTSFGSLKSFVAYPEISGKATTVVLIHENRGLTDWVRSFADQLAAEGFLVIAPDMLSDFSETFKSTTDFPGSDGARKAIYQLDGEKVIAFLDAAIGYAKTLPSASSDVHVAGFCWGGSKSFAYAAAGKDVKSAMVFYGSPPALEELKNIQTQVIGFYGENDNRINSSIEATEKEMKRLSKVYDYEIYPGAGHAFMRRGESPDSDEANRKARDEAFSRMISMLKAM